ncbi:hypothetical protein [Deinococcus radiophilus]|uniref:VCBS repeat-containing protein n=1 Tax=Deinococcus radiophilus TaxID=32062 RepID=A0A431W1U2_9DEIO|nr:hypothetical protein [Deinococcus radiophilus]RTR29462.1 hypothetical protein EJ104_03490 [Deinococcus radiophilus]UFA50703.1 hypothetical protein LMT64_02010 [Deinococcus radiophilus]
MMQRLLLLALLLWGGAAALTPAEVERWPVIYDPAAPSVEQRFSSAEAALLTQIAGSKPVRLAMQTVQKEHSYRTLIPLGLENVLFSVVAPFRTAQPERLTVFDVMDGEPPVLLAVLSSEQGSAGWLVDLGRVINTGLCGATEGYSLRDLNRDGRREMALVIGCGDAGSGSADLSLLDWQAGELRQFGQLEIYRSDPFGSPAGSVTTEATVHVLKGARPRIVSVEETLISARQVQEQAQPQVLSRQTTLREMEPISAQDRLRVRRLW